MLLVADTSATGPHDEIPGQSVIVPWHHHQNAPSLNFDGTTAGVEFVPAVDRTADAVDALERRAQQGRAAIAERVSEIVSEGERDEWKGFKQYVVSRPELKTVRKDADVGGIIFGIAYILFGLVSPVLIPLLTAIFVRSATSVEQSSSGELDALVLQDAMIDFVPLLIVCMQLVGWIVLFVCAWDGARLVFKSLPGYDTAIRQTSTWYVARAYSRHSGTGRRKQYLDTVYVAADQRVLYTEMRPRDMTGKLLEEQLTSVEDLDDDDLRPIWYALNPS